jgi:hypothetical protein
MSTPTDAEIKSRAVDLEQCALFVDSKPIARAMTDGAATLRALLTERAAHAQAVAQAREGIKKASAKCEQLASVIKPGDGNLAAAWANGCDDCQRAIEGIALIPTPSQEDRT